MDAKQSYQLLIPYLEEFSALNPGSTVCYKKNAKDELTKMFICPGIMNNKLRFIRPVVSVDSAHLGSKYKGTLCIATQATTKF